MGFFQRADLTRLFALVALTVSAALLAESLHPNLWFCGYDAPCQKVLSSPFGRVLGVPLPLIGVLTFAAVLGLSLFPVPRTRWLLALLAAAAGAGGAVLILVQVFVLRQLCPYCLVVDAAAVLLAVSEVSRGTGKPMAPPDERVRYGWLTAAALAFVAAVVFASVGGWVYDREAPPQLTALWLPEKINVVEAVDFECPHCRDMHAVVGRLLEEEPDVHFVRLAAPMATHPHSRHAARAFLCAQAQGKGDAMAEALFAAENLTPEHCEEIAASLGIPLDPFRACVADPATDERLDADLAWIKAASPDGLPVVWVQERMFFGVQSLETLRAAVAAARARAALSTP
jgi:uncharacterized membrane protein/protein-disulfide isomerase